jgi:hypothetical protein
MRGLVKKLHIYLGLLNFCSILVFGIAGLNSTFQGPEGRESQGSIQFRNFKTPANLSDKQVADLVYQTMRFPLSEPIPAWALHRNSQNQLEMEFWTFNGLYRVAVLEQQGRLRIESSQRSVWAFLNVIHTLTMSEHPSYLALRLWQYYNEFAIWSLILMTSSGVFLWLASRPGLRWAQYCFGSGCGVFIVLYLLTR